MKFYDKTRLPAPENLLRLVGAEQVSVRGLYLSARCPFPDHADRSPSFSMHGLSGAWRCFGCHRHGGDSLALYMALTGLPFNVAVRSLGGWGVA